MNEAYLAVNTGVMAFSIFEAALLAEGSEVVEGTFRQTTDVWTGVFESTDGGLYAINDGYIKEVIA